MSEHEVDFAEILRSPLEPDPHGRAPSAWLPLVGAFLLGGAIAATLVSAVANSDEPDAVQPIVVPAPEPVAPATIVGDATPFPDDYTAIATDVAVRAETPIVYDDRMLVPMTSVVRRGADAADVARPIGGRWEVRTGEGIVRSQRIVYDAFLPDVFSVEFPSQTEMPGGIVMIERWDGTEVSGEIEMPWPGVTYRSDAPIVIDLGTGASLVVTDLELGNFLGHARWELRGAELGFVELSVELLDESGSLFGPYVQASRSVDPEPLAGFISYFWQPGFRVDQDDAAALRLTANVVIGVPAATEIEVPLPS